MFAISGLLPRDVGAYHTDAFERLGEIYKSEKPKSKLDTMIDISNILSNYCGEGNHECVANAHKATLQQFHAAEQKNTEISYPQNFDETAKKSMELILAIVNDVNENNCAFLASVRKIYSKIHKKKYQSNPVFLRVILIPPSTNKFVILSIGCFTNDIFTKNILTW